MNIPEFYPTKQGRPKTPDVIDLESGFSTVYESYTVLKGEYDKVEALLDKLLSEQIAKIQELLIEVKQIKLHLASLSDANIDERDVDTD